MDASFEIRSDPADLGVPDEVRERLQWLGQAIASLQSAAGVHTPADVEIIVAADIAATVRSLDGQVHTVEDLTNYALERVAGTVAAKTLYRNQDKSAAVIVLGSDLFTIADPQSPAVLLQQFVAGHELAHVLIDRTRACGGPPMEATSLPWEASRWLARYAIEEYHADRVAEVLLGTFASVSSEGDDDPLPASQSDIGSDEQGWVNSANDAVKDITKGIHRYRLVGNSILETMWIESQIKTSQVLIALAHAQAVADFARDGSRTTVTTPVRAECEPLHRLWSIVHNEAQRLSVAEGDPATFHDEEQQVLDTCGDAIVAFWSEIGLSFARHDDSYFIHVAHPQDCWRPSQ